MEVSGAGGVLPLTNCQVCGIMLFKRAEDESRREESRGREWVAFILLLWLC